jgi:hypothetical protein
MTNLLWRGLLWLHQRQQRALMTPAEAWKALSRAEVIR